MEEGQSRHFQKRSRIMSGEVGIWEGHVLYTPDGCLELAWSTYHH